MGFPAYSTFRDKTETATQPHAENDATIVNKLGLIIWDVNHAGVRGNNVPAVFSTTQYDR